MLRLATVKALERANNSELHLLKARGMGFPIPCLLI